MKWFWKKNEVIYNSVCAWNEEGPCQSFTQWREKNLSFRRKQNYRLWKKHLFLFSILGWVQPFIIVSAVRTHYGKAAPAQQLHFVCTILNFEFNCSLHDNLRRWRKCVMQDEQNIQRSRRIKAALAQKRRTQIPCPCPFPVSKGVQ